MVADARCRLLAVEGGRSPKFPHRPLAASLMLLRPRRDRMTLAVTHHQTRPRVRERPWLSQWTFEAQSHGLSTCCLRFKAASRPAAMQDSLLTCAATLWWAGLKPAGPAVKGFSDMSVHIAFSFRELTWRNPAFSSPFSHPCLGGPGRLLGRGSRRSVRARISAYGSSSHGFRCGTAD